jgi:hypothetical protein
VINFKEPFAGLTRRLADVALAMEERKPVDVVQRHWRDFYALARDVDAVVASGIQIQEWTTRQRKKRGR